MKYEILIAASVNGVLVSDRAVTNNLREARNLAHAILGNDNYESANVIDTATGEILYCITNIEENIYNHVWEIYKTPKILELEK